MENKLSLVLAEVHTVLIPDVLTRGAFSSEKQA
jgi:hypothetical protein